LKNVIQFEAADVIYNLQNISSRTYSKFRFKFLEIQTHHTLFHHIFLSITQVKSETMLILQFFYAS